MEIAEQHELFVIEDAAQAFNAKYRERYLGTWGHMGCYSFHGTKNLTCGEGGALLLNRKKLLERAEIICQKGTNRNCFLRGEADSYSWVDTGSSYAPSEILMALLFAQMKEMDAISREREKVFHFYDKLLKKYDDKGLLKRMKTPPGCSPNYHIYYILFPDENIRNHVMDALNARNIRASFHFIPLHSSPMGVKLGYKPEDLRVVYGTLKMVH